MIKKTDDLMNQLRSTNNIEKYIKENQVHLVDCTLSQHINGLLAEKQLIKSDVIRKSEINEIYGYQLFSGKRNPSRDKLICLCIGMELTIAETQQTLRIAGFAPLYPKNERDSIIIFGIQTNQNVCEINEILYHRFESTLS